MRNEEQQVPTLQTTTTQYTRTAHVNCHENSRYLHMEQSTASYIPRSILPLHIHGIQRQHGVVLRDFLFNIIMMIIIHRREKRKQNETRGS